MARPRTIVRYLAAEKEHIALLNKLLAESAKDVQKRILANAAKTGVSATLTNVQMRAQLASILAYQRGMWSDVESLVRKGRADAAAAASRVVSEYENDLLKLVLDKDNLKILSDAEALRAAAGVENTVARILSSERPLSATVYGAANISNRQVSNLVNKGLIQGWNARQLAKEVRQFIDPDVPGGVSYSARRLARTEINNAFHATAQDRYKKDGIVDLVDWKISGSHPRPDECDSLQEDGPYPIDEVPDKPHPQCLCVIEPHLPDPDEFLRKMFNGDYGDAPWNPEDRIGGFNVNLDVDLSGLRKTGASATAAPSSTGKAYREADWASDDLPHVLRSSSAAAKTYVSEGYYEMNTLLRTDGGDLYGVTASQKKKFMGYNESLASELMKGTIQEDVMVHRGMAGDGLGRMLFGQGRAPTLPELQAKVGTSFTEKGFTSTWARGGTMPTDTRFTGKADVMFNINLPKGTRGSKLTLGNRDENEFLLPPGADFVITGVRQDGGQTIIDLLLVGQKGV